jgi:hypothetical protein
MVAAICIDRVYVAPSLNGCCLLSLRCVSVQSPIRISDSGARAFVPYPHSDIAEARKLYVPAGCLFSQSGFPCGFPDPLRLATGQTRFAIVLERCRIPISPTILSDPFPVPGSVPFIQTSFFHQNPFRLPHARPALASLQANAFFALVSFPCLLFRSREAKVAKKRATLFSPFSVPGDICTGIIMKGGTEESFIKRLLTN